MTKSMVHGARRAPHLFHIRAVGIHVPFELISSFCVPAEVVQHDCSLPLRVEREREREREREAGG
jgi:hypothetical protein